MLLRSFMSIIMTRFILNLRLLQWSDPESRLYSMHLTRSASLRFAPSVLDNIGAPLNMDGADHDDDDEHDEGSEDHQELSGDSIHEELIPMRGPNRLDEYSAVSETEFLDY